MARFLSRIKIQPVDIGRNWRLGRVLAFESDRHGRVEVPKNFVCDLSSIPRLLWFISPPTDFAEAGAVHDWSYRLASGISRRVGDDLYREALIALGCGPLRARVRWFALRLFGWWSYRGFGRRCLRPLLGR